MKFDHQAPLLGLLVLCSFSCLFCAPALQAREEGLSNRSTYEKIPDSLARVSPNLEIQVTKSMKCNSSSTRRKSADDSVLANGTAFNLGSLSVNITPESYALVDLTISPSSGDTDTLFTFRVKYTNTCDAPPYDLYLVTNIAGGKEKYSKMTKESPLLKDNVSGNYICYFVVTQKLDLGVNTYFVKENSPWVGADLKSASYTINVKISDLGITIISIIIFVGFFAVVFLFLFKKSHLLHQSSSQAANRARSNNQGNIRVNNSGSSQRSHAHPTVNPRSNRAINNPSYLVGQRINGIVIRDSPSNFQQARTPNARVASAPRSHGWFDWDDNEHHINARYPANQGRASTAQIQGMNPRIPRSAFIPAPSRAVQAAGTPECTSFSSTSTSSKPRRAADFIIPQTNPRDLAMLETWTEGDLTRLARIRYFIEVNDPEHDTGFVDALDPRNDDDVDHDVNNDAFDLDVDRDEVDHDIVVPVQQNDDDSTMPDQSSQYITPHVNPSALASIGTWDEQSLALLAKSRNDDTHSAATCDLDECQQEVDQGDVLMPHPANMLVPDDQDQDTYKLIPNDDTERGHKHQRSYVDAAKLNKILIEYDSIEDALDDSMGIIKIIGDDKGNHIMLLRCNERDDLGPLVPLRWLIRQHQAMIIRHAAPCCTGRRVIQASRDP